MVKNWQLYCVFIVVWEFYSYIINPQLIVQNACYWKAIYFLWGFNRWWVILSFCNCTENIVEQPFDSHSFAICGFQYLVSKVYPFFPTHHVCIYVPTHFCLYTQEMSVALAPRGHICWGGQTVMPSETNLLLSVL